MNLTSEQLPRGGVVVRTSAGPIQFGLPPETIKDSMGTDRGVPNVFVLTPTFFDYARGVSFAEAEFPLFYNFFLKQKRARIVCTASQRDRVERIMAESLFGPETVDISSELPGPRDSCPWSPSLRRELGHFRRSPIVGGREMVLADLVEFVEFIDGQVRIDAVTLTLTESGGFEVVDLLQDGSATFVPGRMQVPPQSSNPEEDATRPFVPPTFGVTTLGAGHGFDPAGKTTGFVVWVEGRGIMVDPPVDASHWLSERGVSPRSVEAIILTHVHGDHDAGTLQKALQADRIRVYTTATVYGSFLRKSQAITGLPADRFEQIIDFVPVQLKTPICIHGARFVFDYTLHSIPTVRFQAWFGGRSLVYSADTLNHPEEIDALAAAGVLSAGRAADLHAFPWDHDLIIHEAGVPPIHTSVHELAKLPDDIKSRTVLVHTTAGAIPSDSGLRLAPQGVDRTIVLDAKPSTNAAAIRWLRGLQAVDHLHGLALPRVIRLMDAAKEIAFDAGQPIIRTGDPGDRFYVILDGKVTIARDGLVLKTCGMHEYFGEGSILDGSPRSADVNALTEVHLLVIDRADYLQLIEGTHVAETVRRLHANRDEHTMTVIEQHPVLRWTTSAQRTWLQSLMVREEHADGDLLCRARDKESPAFLVAEGRVKARSLDGEPVEYGPGQLTTSVEAIVEARAEDIVLRASGASVVFRIDREPLREFLIRYPGLYLRLLHADQEA